VVLNAPVARPSRSRGIHRATPLPPLLISLTPYMVDAAGDLAYDLRGSGARKGTSKMRERYEMTPDTFCEVCRLLYDRHLVTGVGGNLCVRVGEEFMVTPSGWS